ncbi:MAG: hypothetical protein Q8N98_05535 [bacterium]|nr:hypothetical protein [bacterium]
METPTASCCSTSGCCSDKKRCLLCIIVAVVVLLLVATLTFSVGKQLGLKQVPFCSPCPACERCEQSLNQPSPDPTAGWKTYTNSFAKFSLKHPKGLVATESAIEDITKVSGGGNNPIKDGEVGFNGQEGNLRIAFVVSSGFPYRGAFGGGCETENRTSINFLGKPVNVCMNEKSLWVLYTQHPQKYSEFSISANFNPPYTINRETILQILSTFRFLD